MKQLSNKDNFWKLFLFSTLLLIAIWVYRINKFNGNARYSVGHTTKSLITKGNKQSIYYFFYVDEKKYQGSYLESSFLHQGEKIKEKNGKYIIVYSSKDPTINYLLPDKSILEKVDLDSLSKVPVAEEDIDWKKL